MAAKSAGCSEMATWCRCGGAYAAAAAGSQIDGGIAS